MTTESPEPTLPIRPLQLNPEADLTRCRVPRCTEKAAPNSDLCNFHKPQEEEVAPTA